jgi:hypothetical protein
LVTPVTRDPFRSSRRAGHCKRIEAPASSAALPWAATSRGVDGGSARQPCRRSHPGIDARLKPGNRGGIAPLRVGARGRQRLAQLPLGGHRLVVELGQQQSERLILRIQPRLRAQPLDVRGASRDLGEVKVEDRAAARSLYRAG